MNVVVQHNNNTICNIYLCCCCRCWREWEEYTGETDEDYTQWWFQSSRAHGIQGQHTRYNVSWKLNCYYVTQIRDKNNYKINKQYNAFIAQGINSISHSWWKQLLFRIKSCASYLKLPHPQCLYSAHSNFVRRDSTRSKLTILVIFV